MNLLKGQCVFGGTVACVSSELTTKILFIFIPV